MQVVVLAGGIGAARFLKGLVAATGSTVDSPQITVVGNTADDITLFGLKVCPDLDSVMYTLGGGADEERGWGRADETYSVQTELSNYGASPDWFTLGDRDFATHIVRTQMLGAGYPLTAVTQALGRRWHLPVTLLPMTDDRVETHVVIRDPETDEPRAIHFQEWWVRHRAAIPAQQFVYVGQDVASVTTDVKEAIAAADLIVLPPSNPVVSIAPILGVGGVYEALQAASAPIVGISPIVGDAPVRGMADACLKAIDVPITATGVATHYGSRTTEGILDAWIIDSRDETQLAAITELGIASQATETMFDVPGTAQSVAQLAINLGQRSR